MSRLIITLFIVIFYIFTTVANNVGEPLYLTPLIEKGKYQEARQSAEVHYNGFKNIKSYSGFITVYKTYNSNTFFWFVLSQSSNPSEDPLILWSDGGPGSSAMYSLFNYNGPFSITKDQRLQLRNDTITRDHNVIYVDKPIGTGFSYTENDLGFSRSQDDIGRNEMAFLLQFFKLFPEFRKNDFYVGADSYGGRYTITISRFIKNYNSLSKVKINFKGLLLSNAVIDPSIQETRANFLYDIGLIDWNERNIIKKIDDEVDKLRQHNDSLSRIAALNEERRNLMLNFTGYTAMSNYLVPEVPDNVDYYVLWIQSQEVRRALHVGNIRFDEKSSIVRKYLKEDEKRPFTSELVQALEDHPVLAMHGQMDLTLPFSYTQKIYMNLSWSGVQEYRKARKEKWYSRGVLAGYIKRVGNFVEVMVRNAGHAIAGDQPAWFCDIITQFTHKKL